MDQVKGRKTEVAANILETVGDTPMVALPSGFDPDVECEVLLKVEFTNPGGSIKDRIALHMVEEAHRRGDLGPGGRIIECSSGNTGVGLCMVAAALKHPITIVIPDKMSPEKIGVLGALGADVIVTPANAAIDSPEHYTKVAERLAEETPGAWCPNQYHNPDNTQAHYLSTGPEIWQQCEGRLTAFVAGAGTGGTLTGVARFLKEKDAEISIVGVDPPGSILAHFWKTGEVCEPGFYAVEGVGEEEVPAAWDPSVVDDYKVIDDGLSFRTARKLAKETGIFSGGSAGMNLAAALEVARGLPADARVVTLLPDSGRAYLSKVHDEDWMKDCGYFPRVPEAEASLATLLRGKPRTRMTSEDSLAWAVRQAGELGIRPLPILDPGTGDLLGVLDEKKAIRHLADGDDLEVIPVGDCLEPAPLCLKADDSLQACLDALADGNPILVDAPGGWTSLDSRDLLRGLKRVEH